MAPPCTPEPLPAQPGTPTPYERAGLGAILLAGAGSLLAIPGVFLSTFEGAGMLGPFLIAPLIEELFKPAGLLILLSTRKMLVLPRTTGMLLGALSGLVFALLENALYFHVYHPAHSPAYVAYRCTVCVALHMVCSAIVGFGLASQRWRLRVQEDGQELPLVGQAAPHLLAQPRERAALFDGISVRCLVVAVSIHAIYNVGAAIFGGSIR